MTPGAFADVLAETLGLPRASVAVVDRFPMVNALRRHELPLIAATVAPPVARKVSVGMTIGTVLRTGSAGVGIPAILSRRLTSAPTASAPPSIAFRARSSQDGSSTMQSSWKKASRGARDKAAPALYAAATAPRREGMT